ncbi:MAG: hypothetical protein UEP78_01710 [Negativibacillus sp.]|nr:hypothetical protein [Negativibacillus sp.]
MMETSKYIRQNKGCSFLCVPREMCAAFVLLWGINPESFLYNWAIYALVVLLWAGFAMASQWKRFWQTALHPAMLLSFGWPVLLAVYAAAGHVEFPFHHLLMPIFYLMFWFYFSLEDRFSLKLLTFLTTAYYLLINVGTVFALRQNPDVSRLLANGDPTVTAPLASPLTGGYQHIYSLTMFTVALVGIIWYYRPKLLETIGWGMAVLLGLLVIVMSNYSFAILFVFAFSLLVLCRLPKRGGPATAVVLLCALAAMVILPNLYRVFYFIAENTDSLKMQLRFAEVGNLLSGAGITQGSDAGTRMKLYTTSLKSFLSAPLFGIGDLVLKTVDNPREIVGGHSIVCDYLAYYGLVGSVLFHSILVTNFARIEKILDRRGRFLYLVVFVLYYVQITVNAGYNEPLIEVLFLLVPALLVINTERCRTRAAAAGDSQYIRTRAAQQKI